MTQVCFTGKDDFLDNTRAACERAAMDALSWTPVQRVGRNSGPGSILVHRAHPNLTGKLRAARANGWTLMTYQDFYERVGRSTQNTREIEAAFGGRANMHAPVRDGGRMAMPEHGDLRGGVQRTSSGQRRCRPEPQKEDVFDDTTRDLDI